MPTFDWPCKSFVFQFTAISRRRRKKSEEDEGGLDFGAFEEKKEEKVEEEVKEEPKAEPEVCLLPLISFFPYLS